MLYRYEKFPLELINEDFIKSGLLEQKYFLKIKDIVFDIIQESYYVSEKKLLCDDWNSVLRILESLIPFKVYKSSKYFVHLENIILEFFEDYKLLDHFAGIEFPCNIRVSHSVPPPNYANYKYQTDKFHSDLWSGEPKDLVNYFLYIEGNMSNYLKLYNVDQENLIKSINLKNGFDDSSTIICDEITYNPVPSQQILFNGGVPHQTFRNGKGVRVSLDFRFRTSNLYNYKEHEWSNAGQSHSRYWSIPKIKCSNIISRMKNEIQYIKESTSNLEIIADRMRSFNELIL